MTSSSSLYSTPPNQDVSSTNSTSLYGGADTPIPDSSGNVVVRGDLLVLSGNILTTATTGNIFPANATTVNLGNAATTVNIGANTGTTTINNNLVVDGGVTAGGADFGNITIAVADDNTISTTSGDLKLTSTTNNINLTQGLTFTYSEANNRLNRPNVQSTTGNTSGLRVTAPNATTSAAAVVSAFSSNDDLNGKYINFQARGSSTDPLRITTGEYVAGVLQASGDSIAFRDGSGPTYATINPAGPTVGTDLTTKSYVDSIPNVSYTIDASTTTGGANFNLVGSDASTDTIKFAQGTGISVTRTDANTITITNTAPDTNTTYTQNISSTTGGANLNLVGSDSTTDTVKFANGTGVTVSYTDASTATIAIGQAVATTDDVVFNSVNTPNVFGGGPLTLTGGVVTPSNIVVGDDIVASLTGGIGGDTATLSANAGSLTWNHVAGPMVMGSVSGAWALNVDGTTSFPSYTFPYADGTANQVLKSDGAGNLSWYSPSDLNTTYTIDASATTGGANLNLVGSDSTTDTVKIASGTGITIAQTDASTITVNSTITQYTDAMARASISATGDISYNSTTGVISYTAPAAPVISVNGQTGVVVLDTDDVSEGATNLYFTTARARSSVSAGTGISYNSTTGVIDSTITQYTDAMARASISATGDISYNSTTGVISYTAPAAPVTSVNGKTGTVVLTTTDIAEGTNLYYTDARARGAVSAGTGISYNSTTGVITNSGVTSLAGSNHISVNASTGAITVTSDATNANTPSTIVARDASGNFSAGTITANLADGTRVLGALTASANSAYTFPAPNLNTITNNNGLDAASSFANGTSLGNGAQGQFTHYFGDTFSGPNTSAVFSMRSANGNSVTGSTLPFSGLTSVAPSAVTTSNVLGGINFNGYATTGFSDYVSTQNQGGGYNAVHALQVQAVPLETFVDGTLTISGATITAVSRVNVAQTVTSVSGTRGQLTIPSTLAGVGTAVVVTGTLTGTATGISAGTYYIVANNGGASNSTEITLGLTPGGAPITTTPGTVTGLTFTRQLITVTYTAQTNIPFGQNAKVAVSGFTNVTSGTYMVVGTSTATTVTIGALSSGVPALTGSQSVSCPTVTNGGTSFRVRGYKAATPLNSATRTNFIDHGVATATYKSDQFTVQGGTNTYNYLSLNASTATLASTTVAFNTLLGVGLTGNNLTYNRVYGQFQNNTTITPAAANTPAAFALPTTASNNITTVGSTSRVIFGAAGTYNVQFSVQIVNTDNATDHTAWIWFRKNGTDIADSGTEFIANKNGGAVAGTINLLVSSANATDYVEVMYAVDSTSVTFPWKASQTSPFARPGIPSIIVTSTPVGA